MSELISAKAARELVAESEAEKARLELQQAEWVEEVKKEKWMIDLVNNRIEEAARNGGNTCKVYLSKSSITLERRKYVALNGEAVAGLMFMLERDGYKADCVICDQYSVEIMVSW